MDENAKHTPGPWVAKWSKYRDNTFIVQAGMPSNRVLASFDGDGDGPDAQSLADARLIAAAPTLAAENAALRTALEWALNNANESDHPHYPYLKAGKWCFPFLGLGTGVGEAAFDTALEAVIAAQNLEKGNA